MRKQVLRILGLTCGLALSLLNLAGQATAQVIFEFHTPDQRPYRVLEDPQPDTYWVVLSAHGLLSLSEDENGNWAIVEYPLPHVHDATGPDALGMLYATFRREGQSGVYVFNCANAAIEETIVLGTDYVLTGLALSNDETRLYVLGWDWPRVGEFYNSVESTVHRDSGLVWEIDTSTYQVLRQGVVSALPKTIYRADNDVLLIYSQEVHYLFDIWPQSEAIMIDLVGTEPALMRIAQIQTICSFGDYENDFIDWSDEEPLVAMFASSLDWNQEDNYEYMSAIWIINTETNEVVQTLKVFDQRPVERYVNHGVLSDVHPGRVYVTTHPGPLGEGVYAIDKDTGATIDRIFTGYGVCPEFVCEIPDGRLIVTCPRNEKILIIAPD
jgi:hypothetical protein